MIDNQIMVSVYCLAYNHGKYIRQTLDGFVNQVTSFRYEVIVHDDASPDDTAHIIREYEEKYPKIIHGIYQTVNQYSQKVDIVSEIILPHVKGKYVAICEGDDYWTDTSKLQKQVDALEQNKECFFCVHKTVEVSEDEKPTGVVYPSKEYRAGIITPEDFLMMGQDYSFQTSSYMFNGDKWREYQKNQPEFKKLCSVGDETYMLYFANLGAIYYINEEMSCYRRGVPSSWSEMQKRGNRLQKTCDHAEEMVRVLQSYDKFTDGRFHKVCLMRQAQGVITRLILSGKVYEMLKKENRELFDVLATKQKIKVIAGSLAPKTAQKIYQMRLFGKIYSAKAK